MIADRDCRTWPSRYKPPSDYPFVQCETHGRAIGMALCPHIKDMPDGARALWTEKASALQYGVLACSERCAYHSVMTVGCVNCFIESCKEAMPGIEKVIL